MSRAMRSRSRRKVRPGRSRPAKAPIQLARGELCIIAARDPAALMEALNAVASEGDGQSAAEHSLCIPSKLDSQGREWLIAILTPIAVGGER